MRPQVRSRAMIASTLAAVIALTSVPPSLAVARTTEQCVESPPSVHQGAGRKAPETSSLTTVVATLEKQDAPLCFNPSAWTPSASSWWVMIQQTDSTSDYIQYGFWNCAIGCGFACCQTNGEVHEFWERNNGNVGGHYRVDLGPLGSGRYIMRMRYTCPTGERCRFTLVRDGVVQAQSFEDGWRDGR